MRSHTESEIVDDIEIGHQWHIDVVEAHLCRIEFGVSALTSILETQFQTEVVESHIFHTRSRCEARGELCFVRMDVHTIAAVYLMTGEFGEIDADAGDE